MADTGHTGPCASFTPHLSDGGPGGTVNQGREERGTMYLWRRTKPPEMGLLVMGVLVVTGVQASTEFSDTLVTGVRTLTLADSPYMVRDDVLVTKEGELVIEPGVTLQFSQGVGITVRGVLSARGRPDRRITLTTSEMVGRQENRTIRLVDGPTVNQGIIQVRPWSLSSCHGCRPVTVSGITISIICPPSDGGRQF